MMDGAKPLLETPADNVRRFFYEKYYYKNFFEIGNNPTITFALNK